MNAVVGLKLICIASAAYIFQKKVLKLWLHLEHNGMVRNGQEL